VEALAKNCLFGLFAAAQPDYFWHVGLFGANRTSRAG
jgi:hypothetical protein